MTTLASSSLQSSTANTGADALDRRLSVGLATAWVVMLVFILLFLVRPWPDILLHIDFSSHWTGALLLRSGEGEAMYDAERQYALQLELRRTLATSEEIRNDAGYNPYPNPPPLALLYLPLTYLPISTAYLLWWALSMASFLAAMAIPLRGQPMARSKAVVMLSFVAVTHTLFEGQPYGLFALALTLALCAMRAERRFLAGALLGLLWLKPQYAVLIPVVLLLKGRFRELSGMVFVGAALGAGSLMMVGFRGAESYLSLLSEMGEFHYYWVDPWSMVNWRGVITALSPDISSQVGSLLVLALGGVTVAASLLVWRGPWLPSSPRFGLQWLVSMLAVVVAAPHSHILGVVLALPALALSLSLSWPHQWQGRAWCALLALGYALGFATWPIGVPRWLFVPYFLLLSAVVIVHLANWRREDPVGRPAR